MFGQASCEADIRSFVSADSEAKKVYDLLEQPNFEFIDIRENVLWRLCREKEFNSEDAEDGGAGGGEDIKW